MTGHWLQPALAGGVLVILAGSAWAQDLNITGLRTDPVMLYRDCQMDQGVAVTKQEFKGPWPARRDPTSSLYLHLVRDGVKYCVKAFLVSTDQVISVPKDSGCGAQAGRQPPKTGATRGIGEACRGAGDDFGLPAGTPGRRKADDDFGAPAGTPGARPAR
jgi:hypothetical protein